MKLRNTLLLLSNKLQGYSETTRTFIQTGVIALVSALSSVAFLVSTNLLFNLTFVAFASHSVPFFIVASFLTILLTSLAVGLLLNFIAPVAALLGAMLGLVFQRSVLFLRPRIKNQKRIPPWALPLVGGLITWVLGISIYATMGKIGVFGLGYQDLSAVLNNHFIWWLAGIMIVAKLGACRTGGFLIPKVVFED